MTEYLVEVNGEPPDIAYLKNKLDGTALSLFASESGQYLKGALIDEVLSISVDVEAVRLLVHHLNAAATLLNPRFRGVDATAICEIRQDGSSVTTSVPTTKVPVGICVTVGEPPVRLDTTRESLVISADGKRQGVSPDGGKTVIPIRPSLDLAELVALARHDSDTAHILDLLIDEPGRWAALYRAKEAIEKTAGVSFRKTIGPTLASKLELFDRTANIKRHGRKFVPPKHPMTLFDAELYVRQLADAILRPKFGPVHPAVTKSELGSIQINPYTLYAEGWDDGSRAGG